MRQQDGRSRGFGYVTVDSLAAARLCVAEPQVVDNRVVDMKIAVPETIPVGPEEALSSVSQLAPPGLEAAPSCGPKGPVVIDLDTFMHNPSASDVAEPGTRQRGTVPERFPNLHRMPVSERKKLAFGKRQARRVPEAPDEDLLVYAEDYVSFLEVQQTLCGLQKAMSAKAPEYIPKGTKAPKVLPSPAQVAGEKKEGSAKPDNFKADVQLSGLERPPPPSMPPPPPPPVPHFLVASNNTCEDVSTDEDASTSDDVIVDTSVDCLPSLGSALHASGECRRCNFFPKGRCSNDKNCIFCHFPHDQRKKSRQEKRERHSLWLEQQQRQEKTKVDVIPGEGVHSLAATQPLPATAQVPSSLDASIKNNHPTTNNEFVHLGAANVLNFNFADYSDDSDDSWSDRD
jgi:hypothetical protein